MRCQTFSFSFFPCSADHERDWPPCKVVFFGLATNALNVRNNNNNNNSEYNIKPGSQIRVSKYFVCDSASEFGAMGSTSFFGVFSYPNLLLVFSEPVIFRNLYHMFFASVGLSLGLFYFILFFCTLFWVSV